jgi:hypothetical protein
MLMRGEACSQSARPWPFLQPRSATHADNGIAGRLAFKCALWLPRQRPGWRSRTSNALKALIALMTAAEFPDPIALHSSARSALCLIQRAATGPFCYCWPAMRQPGRSMAVLSAAVRICIRI